jgi:ribosomal protein S18 acetylase RimI-like enzyme
MPTIRPATFPADRAPIARLDRAFVTDRIYRVAHTADSFALVEEAVAPPLRKVFPLADDFDSAEPWDAAFVADDAGGIVGFGACSHRAWNRRTEIAHLYVARGARGRGIGRALLAAIEGEARGAGSRCIWLETSNLAHPAIAFYRRLGFALCGLDRSLHDPAGSVASEIALYFARPLAVPTLAAGR